LSLYINALQRISGLALYVIGSTAAGLLGIVPHFSISRSVGEPPSRDATQPPGRSASPRTRPETADAGRIRRPPERQSPERILIDDMAGAFAETVRKKVDQRRGELKATVTRSW